MCPDFHYRMKNFRVLLCLHTIFLLQLVTLYFFNFIKFSLFFDIAVSCMLEAFFGSKVHSHANFSPLFSIFLSVFYLFFHVLCTIVTQKVVVPSLGKLAFCTRYALCILVLFFGGLCESLLNVKTYKSSSTFFFS